MFTSYELMKFECDKFQRMFIWYSIGLIAGGAGIGIGLMVFFQ